MTEGKSEGKWPLMKSPAACTNTHPPCGHNMQSTVMISHYHLTTWRIVCINNCGLPESARVSVWPDRLAVRASGADSLPKQKTQLKNHLVLEGYLCQAECCAQLTTSNKWCLTPSVAMDTYFFPRTWLQLIFLHDILFLLKAFRAQL